MKNENDVENVNTYNVKKAYEIPIPEKINLSIKEAVAYSNVGETTLRRLLAERG